MIPQTRGPWKEGRQGAASLWYESLSESDLTWVAEHHAAVGIRASVSPSDGPLAEVLVGRRWDLRSQPPDLLPGIQVAPPRPPQVPLRGQFAPADPAQARAAIEAVVHAAAWAIWRIDSRTLSAWGRAEHRRLLSWLGDQHASIWCAPIADIDGWPGADPLASSNPS